MLTEAESFLAKAQQQIATNGLDPQVSQWLELGLRDALLRDGQRMLQALLNDRLLLPDDEPARALEVRYTQRAHRVQTLFGPISLKRSYYHHKRNGHGRCPLDEQLDLVRGHTPALAKLICRASTQSSSFTEAAADLKAYSGVELDSRGFGRLVAQVAPTLRQALATLPPPEPAQKPPVEVIYISNDGTGVPMRKAELQGTKGKQPDGSARTREVKLGCVFTQSGVDEKGEPIRDPESTSYVGTFEGCRASGIQLHHEAHRRGYGTAKQVVCIGDGAAWVWENMRLSFPGAQQILDFYHASEHLGRLAQALLGHATAEAKERQHQWCHQLKHSDSHGIIQQAEEELIAKHDELTETQREDARREISYFQTHAERTRYGDYRAHGWFIGSGVVEAGCKTVVGRRLKQSGMFWSQRGGEDLLTIRCLIMGPHFEAAWNARQPILAQQRLKARRWSNQPN